MIRIEERIVELIKVKLWKTFLLMCEIPKPQPSMKPSGSQPVCDLKSDKPRSPEVRYSNNLFV